jgi:uncharacterized phage protein gp47/JayE
VIGIGGTVSIAATCATAGEIGNVPNNVITYPVDNSAVIASIDNPAPATGGVDAEDDDTLRNRILFFKRNPERGGTETDYQRWSFSVAGVVTTHCVNLARGIGSVDIILGAPPSLIDVLVTLVQAAVDLKKPLGVHALVRAANIQAQDFRITVSGITATAAEDAATAYLNTAGVGGTVYFSKLIATIIATGATDAFLTEPGGTKLELAADTMLDPSVYITVV